MPGYDRSGPNGGGPMTGWGKGYCNAVSGGRFFNTGFGRGSGLRRGFRGGGRFLRGYGWGQGAVFGPYPQNSVDELDALKAQADSLKNMLQTIQKRMEELEKSE